MDIRTTEKCETAESEGILKLLPIDVNMREEDPKLDTVHHLIAVLTLGS